MFQTDLYYSAMIVDVTSSRLLWLVINIDGNTINDGCDFTNATACGGALVVSAYTRPESGRDVRIILYVQPAVLPSIPKPIPTDFQPRAWAASFGIERPCASNGFRTIGECDVECLRQE